jgi:steroid 5-alpha reductase family enzyme
MQTLAYILGILACYMTFLFLLSWFRKDNGIADIGYGIGFLVVAISAFKLTDTRTSALILIALVLIWGVRLAVRISMKNKGKPEDFRYKKWREEWGRFFIPRSFLQVYMLQGLVIYVVSLPVLLAYVFPASPNMLLVIVGTIIWIVGFLFEAVGDYQLDAFLKQKTGGIMQTGLWKYSRHPNYFGESTMWWGIAIAASGLTMYPVLGFASPILITFLLLKVSGVPMLEKRWEGNPVWEEYKARTSVFIPMPPKR